VIVLTRVGQKAGLGGIAKDGVTTVLSKPVRQRHLLEALKAALGSSRDPVNRPMVEPARIHLGPVGCCWPRTTW